MASSNMALMDAHGVLIPVYGFGPDNIRDIQNMKLKDGDFILVTYPKCGTTWTQYIMWGVLNEGAPPPGFMEIMGTSIPFLEMTGIQVLENMPSPRTMKLHTPLSHTPFVPEARYIYVARNPFDGCISYFNHVKEMDAMFKSENLTFDEFFEGFMAGQVPFGDYFVHVLDWYEHRNDPNVLFLFFEQMKADPRKAVLQVAGFMNRSLSPTVLENVLKHSSFDYMKKNLPVFIPTSAEDFSAKGPPKGEMKQMNFFRKGQVGGWREFMNSEQQQRLLARINDRVHSPELKELLIPSSLRGK